MAAEAEAMAAAAVTIMAAAAAAIIRVQLAPIPLVHPVGPAARAVASAGVATVATLRAPVAAAEEEPCILGLEAY